MHRDEKRKTPFVAPVRLRNMLWLPIVGGALAASLIWGTPHLRVKHTSSGRDASLHFHSCLYQGLGTLWLHPIDGKCPLIILARSKREG